MCMRRKTRQWYRPVADSSVISLASCTRAYGNSSLTRDSNNLRVATARLPRGSVTAGHMTAQLDAAAELNSNNSESMRTDVDVHTKLTACKFDICNAADSFGEAVWANLRCHSIYAVCEPKKNRKCMWAERNKVHDLAAFIKTLTVSSRVLAASDTSKAFRLQYYVVFKEMRLFLNNRQTRV